MNIFSWLLQCACPPGSSLTAPAAVTCLERFGQIQKIGIQRTKDGATVNEITIASTNPNVAATWTALKAASGNTKVIFTPFINNPANDTPEPRTRGGGNASLGGIPTILGANPSPWSAEFHDIPQSIIQTLKQLNCEVGVSVFLINEHGQIGGLTDSHSSPTTFKGIPAASFFVNDKKFGNFDEVDMNMINWSFFPNFSDLFHIVTPTDFSGLDL